MTSRAATSVIVSAVDDTRILEYTRVSDTARRYRLYGLTLASALDLPCRRASRSAHADVRLVEGSAAQFARARAAGGALSPAWFICRPLPDGSLYLRWRGSFEFLVSANGRAILYRRLPHATLESLTVYLLGQVLSFSLLARGCDPLHGTSVAVGNGAIAFVGDCGFGKSTLAAAFLTRGGRVIADDLVTLRRRGAAWIVEPGIPRLKLAPRIAAQLLGPGARGERMIRGAAKRVIPLDAAQTAARPLPIRAIYVLGEPARSIRIEPLARGDAFIETIRAAFNLIVRDRSRLARQFTFASQVVTSVPVRRLSYPRALAQLPAICDAVLNDIATLAPSA
jgi:hypothetical protein